MRSGTSYFNGPLFWKNVSRYWPLWGLYTAFLALILPLRFWAEAMNRSQWQGAAERWVYLQEEAARVPTLLSVGVLVASAMGVMCAMAMFRYLYSSPSACMIHALPVRREALFLTHYLTGLAFQLVPHLAVFGLMVATEMALGCLNLWPLTLWLLVQSGINLFFYSFAVFCGMFTGNLLALPVFYEILQFVALFFASLTEQVMRMFLYGFRNIGSQAWDVVDWLTPLQHIGQSVNWSNTERLEDGTTTVVLSAPTVVAVYAAVGVVFAAVALLVYCNRHIESAGDTVAVPVMRPVFKYGFALCAALGGGMFTKTILYVGEGLGLMVWMVIWGIAGYFAAEMLLKKSFRVWKNWKGSVVVAAVVCLFTLSLYYDWYGYEKWMPQAQEVTSVEVSGLRGSPWDGANSWIVREDAQGIGEIVALHQAILNEKDSPLGEVNYGDYIRLTYTLADGRTVDRAYDVTYSLEGLDQPGSFPYQAQKILDDRENVAQLYNLENMEGMVIEEAYLQDVWSPVTRDLETVYIDGYAEELWQAVQLDFAEGTIGVRYIDESPASWDKWMVTELCFYWRVPRQELPENLEEAQDIATSSSDWSIALTPEARHTLALLEELGVLDEGHQALTQQEIEMLDF